jgi:hypothetical protein
VKTLSNWVILWLDEVAKIMRLAPKEEKGSILNMGWRIKGIESEQAENSDRR